MFQDNKLQAAQADDMNLTLGVSDNNYFNMRQIYCNFCFCPISTESNMEVSQPVTWVHAHHSNGENSARPYKAHADPGLEIAKAL